MRAGGPRHRGVGLGLHQGLRNEGARQLSPALRCGGRLLVEAYVIDRLVGVRIGKEKIGLKPAVLESYCSVPRLVLDSCFRSAFQRSCAPRAHKLFLGQVRLCRSRDRA